MPETVRVNPFRLFGLPEPKEGTYTRGELKAKMRKLVLVTHPDKETGSEKKFRIVMECYKHLSNLLKEREKTSVEVTSEAIEEARLLRESERIEIPASNFTRFTKGNGKDFDLKSFNQFFEENKLDNPMERGHADWLKQDDPNDIEFEKKRIAKGDFDRVFEEQRKKAIKENRIVRHTGLRSAYHHTNGGTAIDDEEAYGGFIKTKFGLVGTDVREALEVGVIAVDDPRYSQANGSVNIEDAKARRSAASLTLSPEDEEELRRERQEQERMAEVRRQRIQRQSQRIAEHYDRINKFLTN